MEDTPIEPGVPVTAQMLVSPASQTSAPASLCSKPRDRRKMPAFLSNLGKPTLRGIRKCPRCGVYNGTRGLSCKNKACGIVFRDGSVGAGRGPKRGASEVVRVVTDGGGSGGDGSGGPQVFSVRQRGRGSEQRGFVELVLADTAVATADGTLLTRVNLGRCFLPSCRQGQRAAAAPPHDSHHLRPAQPPEAPCGHVKQAMECQARATPLPLKSSVLEGLPASVQAREELWRLATESPGPLVQRASRGTLVVKCRPSEPHPLGLLHLTVGPAGGKGEGGALFRCACQASSAARGTPGLKPARGPCQADTKEPGVLASALPDARPAGSASLLPLERCLHFYACMCAFASDDKLASEFAGFLNFNSNGLQVSAESSVLCASDPQQPEPVTPHRSKRLKVEEPPTVHTASAPALAVRDSTLSGLRKPSHRKYTISTGLKNPGSSQPVDESHVSLPFQQWLASVTEQIHQTMHFQFDGKPEPLVFHISQGFFNALQQRLSLGSKKRRLPNSTTTFVRSDALPLGTFSKYTWHITNLMQVKRIFDTPELPLELTQSFVKNSDGSYSPFRCPEVPPEPLAEGYSRAERPQAIRPLELRTFLRVGTCTPEQKEPAPFVIEWIPDILPRSRVGELRIRFEYGHQLGGQPEYCEGAAQASAEAGQSQRGAAIEVLQVTVP